jgi:hypothetical protein
MDRLPCSLSDVSLNMPALVYIFSIMLSVKHQVLISIPCIADFSPEWLFF